MLTVIGIGALIIVFLVVATCIAGGNGDDKDEDEIYDNETEENVS